MKIACDKCLKVEDTTVNFPKDWLKIRTDYTEYRLCKSCADGFWMAVDHQFPPVAIILPPTPVSEK